MVSDEAKDGQVWRLFVPRGSRGEEGEDAVEMRRQESSRGREAFGMSKLF